MSTYLKFNRARVDDRQMSELIGIGRGMIADGVLTDTEVAYLEKWLAATETATTNPMILALNARLADIMSDGVIDADERLELFETLNSLTGSDFETGEALKSTTLPLCDPAPAIRFDDRRFTFTGSFVFGTRRECEAAVSDRGGTGGTLRRDTAYLVIGEYASDDWIHSSYGRKIERAVEMRDSGVPIHIISERHWQAAL